MNHGRFDAKSGTFHAGDQYRGRFNVDRVNHPRSGPESRMVRVSEVEPSTLKAKIADGSMSMGRTVHALSMNHGRFISQERTIHVPGMNRGWFNVDGVNRPH